MHKGIRIEGLLLRCEGTKSCRKEKCFHGARYKEPFSPDFPHFEVSNNNKFQILLSHWKPFLSTELNPEFAIVNKIISHSIYGQTNFRWHSSQSRSKLRWIVHCASANVMCADHSNYVICKATRGNLKKLEIFHVFQYTETDNLLWHVDWEIVGFNHTKSDLSSCHPHPHPHPNPHRTPFFRCKFVGIFPPLRRKTKPKHRTRSSIVYTVIHHRIDL